MITKNYISLQVLLKGQNSIAVIARTYCAINEIKSVNLHAIKS